MRSRRHRAAFAAAPFGTVAAVVTAVVGLAGCVTPRAGVESSETFDSATTYSRTYPLLDVQTCEAARRTLLSQGYIIGVATAEQVHGRKSFQPSPETHVEVELNVVCAKEGYKGRRTIAFVNAVQDSFAIKKSATSASLGLPAFGSVSLPFTGSDESLVKIASVTIESPTFYDKFFRLLERYLDGDPGQLIPPSSALDPPAAALGAAFAASGAASASASHAASGAAFGISPVMPASAAAAASAAPAAPAAPAVPALPAVPAVPAPPAASSAATASSAAP